MRGRLATRAAWRVIVAVTMAAFLPGCMGWRDRAALAPAPIADRTAFLRVTLQNGHHVELHEAAIVRDSVIGQLYLGTARARGAVALQDVSRIADRQFKPGTSVFAFLGVLLVGEWWRSDPQSIPRSATSETGGQAG